MIRTLSKVEGIEGRMVGDAKLKFVITLRRKLSNWLPLQFFIADI